MTTSFQIIPVHLLPITRLLIPLHNVTYFLFPGSRYNIQWVGRWSTARCDRLWWFWGTIQDRYWWTAYKWRQWSWRTEQLPQQEVQTYRKCFVTRTHAAEEYRYRFYPQRNVCVKQLEYWHIVGINYIDCKLLLCSTSMPLSKSVCCMLHCLSSLNLWSKSKGIPRLAEVALGVPGRLRPQIFLTFRTTRVVGYQPNTVTAFTPGEIPGTHFHRLSQPQGAWFCQKEPRKKSQGTPPGIDPGTVRLVAQRLNHYVTPSPLTEPISCWISFQAFMIGVV